MENKQYYTVIELARILGISRIAVFKKIKKGQIKAKKIGHSFVISKAEVMGVLGNSLTSEQKKIINKAVKKTISEYGETLRLLGDT